MALKIMAPISLVMPSVVMMNVVVPEKERKKERKTLVEDLSKNFLGWCIILREKKYENQNIKNRLAGFY
jgi:hypothetical protein